MRPVVAAARACWARNATCMWLGWLELYTHGDVEAIETPIGMIPKYADLCCLTEKIGKEYPESLYTMQFSLYVDNVLARALICRKQPGARRAGASSGSLPSTL